MRRGGGGRGPPPAPALAMARAPTLAMAPAPPPAQAVGAGRAKAKKAQVSQEGNDDVGQTAHKNDNDFDSQSISSGSIEDYTLLPSLLEKKSSEIDPTAKLPNNHKSARELEKNYQNQYYRIARPKI